MDEWQRQMDRVHNQADLIIAKQRHGPTGTIQLFFEAEFTRFADLDLVHRDHERPDAGPRRRGPGNRSRRHRRQLATALHAASIRSGRRRGQGGRLRPWRAAGRAGAARRGLPALLRRPAGRGPGDPPTGAGCDACRAGRPDPGQRSRTISRTTSSRCSARSPRSMPGPRSRARPAARCRRSCMSIPACRGSASMRANWRCCSRTMRGWTGSRCAT